MLQKNTNQLFSAKGFFCKNENDTESSRSKSGLDFIAIVILSILRVKNKTFNKLNTYNSNC